MKRQAPQGATIMASCMKKKINFIGTQMIIHHFLASKKRALVYILTSSYTKIIKLWHELGHFSSFLFFHSYAAIVCVYCSQIQKRMWLSEQKIIADICFELNVLGKQKPANENKRSFINVVLRQLRLFQLLFLSQNLVLHGMAEVCQTKFSLQKLHIAHERPPKKLCQKIPCQ